MGRSRLRAAAATAIVAPFALFALIRLLGLDHFWPLVPAMAFTPWVAIGACAALIAAIALRAWPAAVAGLLTVAVFGVVLAGRVTADEQPAAAGPEVTILSQNMLAGEADAAQLVRLARAADADVLALQELTPESVAALRAAGLQRWFPHFIDESRWAVAGAGLWSRTPLRRTDQETAALRWPSPEAYIPSLGVRVRSMHPNPPVRPAIVGSWKSDLAATPSSPAPDGAPRILAGDFNATLDNRQLRKLVDRGYRDAADAAGAGLDFTWPDDRPMLAIDHVLVDRSIRVLSFDTALIDGTDHHAVIVRLRLPARRAG